MNFGDLQASQEFYTFKEVSSVAEIKPYVLRFWESEFSEISPVLLGDGSKQYSQSDLSFILKVKDLLFNQKMCIPEAKLILDRESGDVVSDFNPVKIEAENVYIGFSE